MSGDRVLSVGVGAREKSAPDICPVPCVSVWCVLKTRGQLTVGAHEAEEREAPDICPVACPIVRCSAEELKK